MLYINLTAPHLGAHPLLYWQGLALKCLKRDSVAYFLIKNENDDERLIGFLFIFCDFDLQESIEKEKKSFHPIFVCFLFLLLIPLIFTFL